MKTKYIGLLVLTALIGSCKSEKESQSKTLPDNPLFVETNQPVAFDQLTSQAVEEATTLAIEQAEIAITTIAQVNNDSRNFENTMLAMDDFINDLSNIYSTIYLMGSTHSDSLIRNTAIEKRTEIGKYFNEIQLNENLYNAVNSYSQTEEAKGLVGYKKIFLKETLAEYERSGFALPKEKRNELKVLLDEISEIGNQFNTNIAEYQDFLILSEVELEGLPDDYKAAHKQEDNTYKIGLSYPDSGPFFRMAKSDQARKSLKEKYDNRAADTNPPVLMNLIQKRSEMAQMLGYDTYAEYVLDDRMAKSSQTVWDFEKKLKNKLRPKAELDMDEMLEFKSSINLGDDEIKIWEYSYIKEKLLSEKYGVDNEKVKEYFELENVKKGLFAITQNLFGLEYKKTDAPVWHKDVDAYEVYQDGQMIGRFYLDLFPRANKYGHAACFPMVQSKQLDGMYQNPAATLVCNFPEPTESKPALMTHGNVETFFHEFGHVLHNLLSKTKLSSQGGTSVSRDFVEAPSQIFENWAWNYESLSLFAQHYETGDTITKALFDKMLEAKNVMSGLGALRQVHYGTFDLTLYDGYQFTEGESTSDLWHSMYKENTMISSLPDTKPEASFGHLNGYAAGYYGYMWSLVYAQDMFSVFEENGIMNPEIGKKYRDEILSQGGSKDEMEMLINFLGREPNEESFVKSLGL